MLVGSLASNVVNWLNEFPVNQNFQKLENFSKGFQGGRNEALAGIVSGQSNLKSMR